jgi:replication-associated recombination protein RarA
MFAGRGRGRGKGGRGGRGRGEGGHVARGAGWDDRTGPGRGRGRDDMGQSRRRVDAGRNAAPGDHLRKFFDSVVKSGEPFKDRVGDPRKFLEAAMSFEDSHDMLYLLVSTSNNGKKQLKRAISGDASPSFLNDAVGPFLKLLCSEEMILGTARGPIEQLFDAVYETVGFLQNLRKLIEEPDKIRDPTPFAQLIINVATRKSKARDDNDVRGIADALAERELPITQSLRVLLDDGPSALGDSSTEDRLDLPGDRHDNDYKCFRDVRVLPTMDEVLCERHPYLPQPQSMSDARAAASVGDTNSVSSGVATLLDRQFRLLREDFIAPLREELQQLTNAQAGRGRPSRFTFRGVKFIGADSGGDDNKLNPCVIVSFELPQDHGARRCRSKKERIAFWDDHRSILADGALCVLCIRDQPVCFATIVRRIPELLAKNEPEIGLTSGACGNAREEDLSHMLSYCGSDKSEIKAALVQVSTGLFQYTPVLRCLQRMDTIPLVEELVMNQPSRETNYLPNLEDAYRELEDPRFHYDDHQYKAMRLALRNRVSITQGPPGTGKTYIGVRLADIIYRLTKERILCVCFTNHALDDFMSDLLKEGMTEMVRLGGGSKDSRLEEYLMRNLKVEGGDHSRAEKGRFKELATRAENLKWDIDDLSCTTTYTIRERWNTGVGDFLKKHDPLAWSQLCVLDEDMKDEVGFEVVYNGANLTKDALWKAWLKGKKRSVVPCSPHGDERRRCFRDEHQAASPANEEANLDIWALDKKQRQQKIGEWQYEYFREDREKLAALMVEHDTVSIQLNDLKRGRDLVKLRGARIIGCTTTGAAMFKELIEAAQPTVVIVEEAAEILEAHVITSLQNNTKHLIMIGDHKQLRPKLDTYELSVACSSTSHDFNRSLFERLVLSSAVEHASLASQHRMHPEISKLIRPTYDELVDAEKTLIHPAIRGVKSRVVFIKHDEPEGSNAAWKVEANSKTNAHEVGMVRSIVRYLTQQGYDPTQLVVLTPYLGQLQLLRKSLADDFSVLIGEVDMEELEAVDAVSVHGTPDNPNAPQRAERKPVRVSTIDNYQGEEADVVVISLVRSNAEGNIGFLYEPERVNVLLSRARHGQIIIGNDKTFRRSAKGARLWGNLLDQMERDEQMYSGFPAFCEVHGSDADVDLSTPKAFEEAVPCGGCRLLCNIELPCGHRCPLRCHPYDRSHENVKCSAKVYVSCDVGHIFETICGSPADSSTCDVCDDLRRKKQKAAKDLEIQKKELAKTIADCARKVQNAKDKEAKITKQLELLRRGRDAKRSAVQAELRAKDLEIQAELREQAAPIEAEVDELEAREAQAAREAEIREEAKRKLAEEERKLESFQAKAAKAAKDLSKSEKRKEEEEQNVQNQLDRTYAERRDASAEKERSNAAKKTDVEFLVRLRRKLRDAVRDRSRAGVVAAVREAPLSAMEMLVGPNKVREECEGDSLEKSPSLERGLKLLAENPPKILEAIDVFASNESDVVQSHLAVLCKLKLKLSVTDDPVIKHTLEAIKSDEKPSALALLVLASAEVANADRARGDEGHRSIVSGALSYLNSSNVYQFSFCVDIALDLLEDHKEIFTQKITPREGLLSQVEAERRKLEKKATTAAAKKLLALTGIMPVKKMCFQIMDRVKLSKERGDDLTKTNYNTIFTGNPGTGKTTVARLYGELLAEIGVLPGSGFEETSGAKLVDGGVTKLKDLLKNLEKGGVLFVDEAYQLEPKSKSAGSAVLNLLLTEMENLRGKLVVVFAGYDKQMEELLEFNEGLPSRFPNTFAFPDFTEEELREILTDTVENDDRKFSVTDAKYLRIAARRLAKQRGTKGFGNARAVRNLWEKIVDRQSARVIAEREDGRSPALLEIERDDILGPRDAVVATREHIDELNQMYGLAAVKDNVANLLEIIKTNVELEDQEKPVQQMALNRCFLGPPGTGKTTVANLYAKILKSIGLLSKGDVIVKKPADFVGGVLGQSEQNTKSILEKAKGSVLVIDEAYGLHAGSGTNDPYREAVIGTIVAEVQGVPGDDQCVLLLGYQEQMETMMRDGNLGLARRFQINNAFVFEDYSRDDLFFIMKEKAEKDKLKVGYDALRAGVEVLEKQKMMPNFGNGGAVVNLLSKAVTNRMGRMRRENRSTVEIASDRTFLPVDFDPESVAEGAEERRRRLDSLFADLVGCKSVFEKLHEIKKTIEFSQSQGRDPRDDVPFSFVFAGPPGTGKTTVARRMGELFKMLNLLPSSEVVQTAPSDLVTGFVGQARRETRKIFESALGKVLFIDEAYGLDPEKGGPYMQEAVDEMVAILTDEKFKGNMVLILAGYENDMEKMLIRANAGLKSRIPGKVRFDAFDVNTTVKLLRTSLSEKGLPIDPAIRPEALQGMVQELVDAPGFASGRDIHNWVDTTNTKYAVDRDPLASPVATYEHLRAALDSMLEDKRPPRTLPRVQMSAEASAPPRVQMSAEARAPRPPPTVSSQTEIVEVNAERVEEACEMEVSTVDNDDCMVALEKAIQALDWNLAESREKLSDESGFPPEEVMSMVKRELCGRFNEGRVKEKLRNQREAVLQKIDKLLEYERQVQDEKEKERQAAIKHLGKCPMLFAWLPVAGGYRCAGGSHYLSSSEVDSITIDR